MIGSRRRLRLADVLRLRERHFQQPSADLGECECLGSETPEGGVVSLETCCFSSG